MISLRVGARTSRLPTAQIGFVFPVPRRTLPLKKAVVTSAGTFCTAIVSRSQGCSMGQLTAIDLPR